MSGITIPTTQEMVDQNVANIEARLNQTTPANDRAFNKVLAVILAMAQTSLYKYAADRFAASLASTATGSDLDIIGGEYGLYRSQAVAEEITITVTGTDGTVIPSGTVFVDQANGALYTSTADATIASGTATVSATANVAGTSTAAAVSDVMNLQSQIAGVTTAPTCASVTTTGADAETDDEFRIRVLAQVQSVGGGCNASDYRRWALSVTGVVNAYPFAGLPYVAYGSTGNAFGAQYLEIVGSPTGGTFTLTFNGSTTAALNYNATAADIQTALQAISGSSAVTVSVLGNGFIITGFTVWAPIALGTNSLTGGTNAYVLIQPNEPPARTVYVECESSIDADGVAPQSLLDQVLTAITYDATTGKSQQSLGLTNDNLFVLAITRTKFYVQVLSLSVPSGETAACEAAILTALNTYFASLESYVDGVTPSYSRNDLITNPSIARIVQAVLIAYGASCAAVEFGTTSGSWLANYQLSPGEKAGLVTGGLTFA